MKKIIRKYISIAVSLASIVLIIFSLYIIFFNIQAQKRDEFHAVFEHTSYILNHIDQDKEQNEKLFIDSYLTRAQKIAYVLSRYPIDSALLSELSGVADITTINVVNENGIIADSTNKDSIGLSFSDHEKLKEFLPLISNDDPDAYYVQLDGCDFTTKEDMIYLGIKPHNSVKGIIQIGIKPEILLALQNNISISQIYKNMPVGTSETHFILEEKTGNILGVTGFDDNSIEFENERNSNLDMVTLIKACENGKFVKVNGDWQYVYSQVHDGYILAAYVDVFELLASNLVNIGLSIISIIAMAILLIALLNRLLNQYFLAEVEKLLVNIHKVIGGNMDISFETNSKTEFADISEGLNKLVHSFKNRSNRMSKMIQIIHHDVGVFEYLKDINTLFITDNIKELLNLEDEKWNTFRKDNDQFMNYLTNLNSVEIHGETNVYLIANDKYLEINIYQEETLYYGVIKDITKEVTEKKKMLQKLKDIEYKMTIDKLTGLKNIHYIKDTVNKSLKNSQEKGIFLIFDLDNFKHVNDTIGHPEGDKLLQRFASCLTANFRNNDIIARLGGDEFVVFMLGSSSTEYLNRKLDSFIQYVRQDLKEYYVKFQLSVSIGVAATSSTCTNYATLYHNADFALYIAKQNGKDQYYINPDGLTCTRSSCEDCEKLCSRNKSQTESTNADTIHIVKTV